MIERWFRSASAAIVLLCSSPVHGEFAPPSPGQPASESPIDRVVRAYRSGPIGETVQMRVKDAMGREQRAEIVVRIDAGDPATGRPRRARLDLGQLTLSIDGDRLLATHRLERNRYAEFTLAPLPLREALSAVMPVLLLPELVLADLGRADCADLGLFATPRTPSWDPPSIDRPTGKSLLTATAGDAKLKVLADRASGRLASLQMNSPGGDVRSIELTVRPLDPGPTDSWLVQTEGRTRVDTLADLQNSIEGFQVGERFPSTLTLLTTGLRDWEEVSQNLTSVLIFVRIDTSGITNSDAAQRDAALADLRRSVGPAVTLARRLEKGSENVWIARNVAVIPPSAINLDVSSTLLTLLNPTDSSVLSRPKNQPLIAPDEVFDYDLILGGAGAGVVVVDKARFIRGIITLAGIDETEKKVREVLDGLK